MKNPSFSLAIALLLALPTTAFSLLAEEVKIDSGETLELGLDLDECAFPEPPVIPDGLTAPQSELAQAGAAVQEYNSAVEASLACLLEAEESLGEEITPEQSAAINAIHNNGVDQLMVIVDSFNEQVKLFKARPPAEPETE